jgi:UrcA family protein
MFKSLFSLALVAAVASPAFALQSSDQPRSVKVSFADLNLATAEGRATLDRRLKSAVRSVCSIDTRDPAEWMAERRCYHRAFSKAQRDAAVAVARALYKAGETQVAAK